MTRIDPGLQPQRTSLAWTRTGLAIFVNALIVLRAGLQTGQVLISSLGGALLIAAAISVFCGTWRVRNLAIHGAQSAPPAVLMLAMMWIVWLACCGGVGSILVSLPR